MRRALLVISILAAGLVPAVAHATHVEYPEITADCDRFDINFYGNYRSTVNEATIRVVVTLLDENNVEKLRFETEEPLELTGEKFIHYEFGWIWNNITDDIIHLVGLVTVNCELTITAPYGDNGLVDVHTVETGTTMVCDVVADDDVSWGEIKSQYR